MFRIDQIMNPALYMLLGTCATLTPKNGFPVQLDVIDRSAGVEVPDNAIGIMTVQPAATVRMSDLASSGLKRSDLIQASLTMNGKKYRVENTRPKPTINGEADGELFLLLIEL